MYRSVVGVAAVRVDSQDSTSGTSQIKGITRAGNSNRNTVLIKSLNEIAKGFCVIRGCRAVPTDMRNARNTDKQLLSRTNSIAPKLNIPAIEAPEDDIPFIEEPTPEIETTTEKKQFESWDDVLDNDWD